MKKRIIITILSIAICLVALSGCKAQGNSDTANYNSTSQTASLTQDSSWEESIDSQETELVSSSSDIKENDSNMYKDLSFLPEDLKNFFETENRMINRVFGDGAGYLYMGIDNLSRNENEREYSADNGLSYIVTTMDYADFKAYIKNYYSENAVKRLEQGAILDYNGKLALCTSSVGGFSNLDNPYYTDVKVEKDSVTFTKITGEEYGTDSEIVRTWGQSYKFIKASSGWRLDDWGRV